MIRGLEKVECQRSRLLCQIPACGPKMNGTSTIRGLENPFGCFSGSHSWIAAQTEFRDSSSYARKLGTYCLFLSLLSRSISLSPLLSLPQDCNTVSTPSLVTKNGPSACGQLRALLNWHQGRGAVLALSFYANSCKSEHTRWAHAGAICANYWGPRAQKQNAL